MLTSAAELFLIAWLPGAIVFRLPCARRERRAALPAEERVFWQVLISLAISHAIVLGLAAAHRYSFKRLLILDAVLSIVLAAAARFRLKLGGPAPSLSAVVVAALIVLSISRFFPPSEFVIGGKDPGSYVNEGIVIAQRGTLVYEDPTVAAVPEFARDLFFPSHQRSDYYGTRFMGFFIQAPDAGTVVGQFPHLLPASIAMAYGIDGLTGARRAVGFWAILGVIAVYFAGAHWLGRTTAAAAAALLTLNIIEVWYGRYPNAEVVMQALLFAALLANARAHFESAEPDQFFGTVAGTLLGLLLFLRFDAVLGIAAIVVANLLAVVQGRRMTLAFLVSLGLATALAALYMLGPMRAYATYPIEFVRNLRWWHVTALATAGLITGGLVVVARRQTQVSRAIERWLPIALIVLVWTLAIYAFFFRTPEGKLALENAYALRMYAAFYVTVPCLAAAVAGYALATRRQFWRNPAIVITITLFSVFFFYKIRIVAEHFWAARRFVPVILPGTLLLACAAATWGLTHHSRRRQILSGAIGLTFIVLLGMQYARASAAIAGHVEYAGVIPQLEALAKQIGDRDLLIVESRDAESDAHVFALPLAYIYDRRVLVLNSAAPDPATLTTFYGWARTRYDRVLFFGGGGTALLSHGLGASFISSMRFEAPEYASTFNAYPRGINVRKFDFGLYALQPGTQRHDMWFDLDVGLRDDLHLFRFHAKEIASGRTMRWSQDQSFVSVTHVPPGAREVVLTMSSGGRPAGPPPAEVTVFLNDHLLGRAIVSDGFRPYMFALPPGAAEASDGDIPPRLIIRTPVWNPRETLGAPDDRELGVMVDRVQVR
jgi:hypothetical protein